MKIAISLLWFLFITACLSVAQSTGQQQVEAAARNFAEAWANSDVDAVRFMLADDYIHTDTDGKVLNKAAYLAYMQERKTKGMRNHIEFRDVAVRTYGKDVAVITGENIVSGSLANEGISGEKPFRLRFTQVWVNSNGRWQRSVFDGTPVL